MLDRWMEKLKKQGATDCFSSVVSRLCVDLGMVSLKPHEHVPGSLVHVHLI